LYQEITLPSGRFSPVVQIKFLEHRTLYQEITLPGGRFSPVVQIKK
jgi:hypothetical protein